MAANWGKIARRPYLFGLMVCSILSLPQRPWQKYCCSALPFRWLEWNSRNTLAAWAEIVNSCHPRCRPKCVVFLYAPCRFSGPQRRQRKFGADNVQMPDFSRGSLRVWRYARILKAYFISHFHVMAVLYAVGIVELELESTSALVLLLFVIPLAFTLSGFLMWILHSLTGIVNVCRKIQTS